MKFTLMVGFYLIITNKIVEPADVINITSGVTWFEAVSQCGSDGLEYDLTILSGLEQLRNNTFWIGVIRYQVMTPWMYPLVFKYPVHTSADEKCMTSFCNEGSTKRHTPTTCYTKSSSITVVCADRNSSTWNNNYEEAKQVCLGKGQLLLSPNDCSSIPGIEAWTSAFREKITLGSIEDFSDLVVSGTRNNRGTKGVYVERRNCNHTLSLFVCKSALNSGQHGASQSRGALIGGIIGGIATILVIMCLLLWTWWKRKNDKARPKDLNFSANQPKTRKTSNASNMQYGQPKSGDDKTTNEECTMGKIDQKPHEKSVPEYSTVHKHKKEAIVDSVYVSAKEEEYDELNKISSRKIHQSPSNTYGFLGQSDEGEYDTTQGVSIGFVKSTEDMYDSNVPNCKGNLDNTYDTANINQFWSK